MERILVPVDGSQGANKAAEFAGRLAGDTGAAVTLIHVYDAPTVAAMGLRSANEAEMNRARDVISRGSFDAARRAMGEREVPVDTYLAIGHPADEICTYAKQHGFDLIVMGTRGQSEVRALLLGSVSEQVLRHAHCPVTVVR